MMIRSWAAMVASSAARFAAALLNGRAWNIAVGAEDAAVAGLGLENRAAALAVIEILAGVRRHRLRGRVLAMRARDRAPQFDWTGGDDHFAAASTWDGYPAFVVAAITSPTLSTQ